MVGFGERSKTAHVALFALFALQAAFAPGGNSRQSGTTQRPGAQQHPAGLLMGGGGSAGRFATIVVNGPALRSDDIDTFQGSQSQGVRP